MAQHSTLVGGSTADRLLNCPGSYRAIISLPPMPEISSEAANAGTHCHHVMDALMQARMSDSSTDLKEEAVVWLGDTFFDRELTEQTLETLIFPAIDALEQLEEQYGNDLTVAAIEMTASFPGVVGAGGTADLILTSSSHVILVDWKFGAVPVYATIPVDDDDGVIVNAQLLFYLACARAKKPKWFDNRGIVAAIIQPQADPRLSYTDVAALEIDMFEEDMADAIVKALGRDAVLRRGDWCKWCPAKPQCPEWLKPMIELASIGRSPPAGDKKVSSVATPYGEQLAKAKELSELVSAFADEVDRQMEYYLRAGGIVPGWGLEPKKKQRKWVDEAVVVPELIKMGFKDSEIWKHTLQTFEVTDAAAKQRGKTIPAHLRVAPASDEVKIVRKGSNGSVDSNRLLEQLKASVALIDREK